MTKLRVVGDGDGDESKPGRPSGAFDPWDTEKGHEYNPDHFYTRSTNRADHSVDVRFKFPPQLGAMVSQIVDSKKFPQLRTIADFYRDAAVHRLHHLNEMIQDGKYDKDLSLEMRLDRLSQRRQEMDELAATVAKHRETLEQGLQVGDYDSVSETLAYLEDDLNILREPYRTQLAKIADTARTAMKMRPGRND